MHHQQPPRLPHPLPANRPRRQRGIAILTVLVIAVLIVTLAAVIFVRQSRAVRQTDNFQSLERAWQYVFTMEQYAGLQLQLDALTNQFDALTDRWAYDLPEQTVQEANGALVKFKGNLEDLQARYNLNNLVDNEGKLRAGQDAIVKELIKQAGLPEGYLDAIIDWMDKDSLPHGMDGAERLYYLAGPIPYQAADMPFSDSSELRLLRLEMQEPELKQTALQTFLSTICVIPNTTAVLSMLPLKVNINTAAAPILKATGLSNDQTRALLTARQAKKVYKTIDEYLATLNLNPQSQTDQALLANLKQRLDAKSNFFLLKGEIRINRARVFLNSVLFRDPKGVVHVIMRQFDRTNEKPLTSANDASNTPANNL